MELAVGGALHRHYSKLLKKDSFIPVRKPQKYNVSGTQISRHDSFDRMKKLIIIKKQPESAAIAARRRNEYHAALKRRRAGRRGQGLLNHKKAVPRIGGAGSAPRIGTGGSPGESGAQALRRREKGAFIFCEFLI